MSVRFTFPGLAELRNELRRLPADLAQEGGDIITGEADQATAAITAAYPVRSGKLAKGVKQEVTRSQYGTHVRIRSTAKHAHLFEYGTQARHTDIGANRGSMPPGNAFVPPIIRHRRTMYERLRGLLRHKGLTVSG